MKYDRVTWTWLDEAEYDRRVADRQERAFLRQTNQGELKAPGIIGDTVWVQSMADGKFYDSKRALRKHYKEAGVVEIGNEDQSKHISKPAIDPAKRREAIAKGIVAAGLNPTDTVDSIRHDPDGMARLKSKLGQG